MSLLKIRNLEKTYEVTPPVPVLKGVNLDVEMGQKSSLLVVPVRGNPHC